MLIKVYIFVKRNITYLVINMNHVFIIISLFFIMKHGRTVLWLFVTIPNLILWKYSYIHIFKTKI